MRLQIVVVTVLLLTFAGPLVAQSDEQRAAMQEIVAELNENSYEAFLDAIDERRMLSRITQLYPISPEVVAQVRTDFATFMQAGLMASFPNVGDAEINGTLVDFDLQDGSGHALVRFRLPQYRFAYLRFELAENNRGKLLIEDWINYAKGERFSVAAAQSLVAALSSEAALRALLMGVNLDGNDLFLVREIAKAARDQQSERVFEVLDSMREEVRAHPYIVGLQLHAAVNAQEVDLYEDAIKKRLEQSAADPLFAATFANYFIMTQQFGRAVTSMQVLRDELGFDDGGLMSRMSAAALAHGDNADAVDYAARAAAHEPELKLAWWSLLRARAREEDFDGCLEALEALEDDFGDKMTASRLRRDRYGAFTELAASEAFKAWREARDSG